jgi:Protein of unknown function (DUF3307)
VLETAVALVLAHCLADFVLQSDAMVRDKARAPVLLAHACVVALASSAALGFAPVPLLILLVAASHFLIDGLKIRYGGPGFAPFAADQAAHLAMIALAAALVPEAYAGGLWTVLAHGPLGTWLPHLPATMALAAGLVATVWAGGYAVRTLMSGLEFTEAKDSLPKGGQLIGRLERLMILMLLLADQPDGIGLLIAAKSILRFNELARDANSTDAGRRASEYVIIGTLASFAWAIASAWATGAAMRALSP